jgi:hypothetical protein
MKMKMGKRIIRTINDNYTHSLNNSMNNYSFDSKMSEKQQEVNKFNILNSYTFFF